MIKNKAIILFLALSISSFVLTQGKKVYASKEQRKQFYNQLTSKYASKSVQEIWKSDPKFTFDEYVDGKTEADLINDYATVIHELLHAYNETSTNGHIYFIENGIRIDVPLTDVFNSKELNHYVRKSQQDSIFRYGLYIGGKNVLPGLGKVDGLNDTKENEVMSIQLGIYGIIEEFSAYYFGNLACFELNEYYAKVYGAKDENAFDTYLSEANSELVAFFEFKLFISWYLTFAKENYPKMYQDIMNNKALRVVYSLIYEKYENLAKKIEALSANRATETNKAFELLDFSGSDEDLVRFFKLAGLEDKDIYREGSKTVNGQKVKTIEFILDKNIFSEMKSAYIDMQNQVKKELKNDDSLLYFASAEKQFTYLKKQCTPKLQAELENFKIKGVTTSNYLDFLK